MAVTVPELLRMPPRDLDALFKECESGEIPQGDAHGTAILAPGSPVAGPAARLTRMLLWQGKVFDPAKGELRNKILPIGMKSVRARVYRDPSWLDGDDAIILDYSSTSRIAHWIRDEIRPVAPNTYLGLVFWGRKRLIHFALEFPA